MQQTIPSTLMDLILGAAGVGRPAAPASTTREHDAAVASAASIFKALGHEGRLRILCHLTAGECSVSQLENLIDARQSAVSQHLARLKADQLVRARRDGHTIYYSISDARIADLLRTFVVHGPGPQPGDQPPGE